MNIMMQRVCRKYAEKVQNMHESMSWHVCVCARARVCTPTSSLS